VRYLLLLVSLLALPAVAKDPYHDLDEVRPASRPDYVPTGSALLSCDLLKASPSALTEPMYEVPVAFEQRKVTGIYPVLKGLQWGGTPTLESVTVVYESRAPKSLVSEKKTMTIAVNQKLDKKVDVPFFADYFGSREVKFTWDPETRLQWSEKGTFSAAVPGWQLSVEASDPYHQEGYEASLDCKARK